MADREGLKRKAALEALRHVQSDTVVGLGTGSTARYFIEELGARLTTGELERVRGVPTSRASEALAVQHGVPLVDLEPDQIDVAVDGMDEVTDDLNAIKGLGGALTREKLVALAARRFILIGDAAKRVGWLGETAPVPVETLEFGWRVVARELEALGCRPQLRPDPRDGSRPYRSDNGNVVLDCHFPGPFDAPALAREIKRVPGVIEHGLFLGIAERAYVAGDAGVMEITRAPA